MAQFMQPVSFDSLQCPSSDALPGSHWTETTTQLGTHSVEVTDEQTVILHNARVAIALDEDETYRLYTVLHTLFSHSA